MLDPLALKEVVALTQSISERGAYLVPVIDTPISMLVREIPTVGIDPEKATYDTVIQAMVDLSRDDEHGESKALFVENATAAVRRTLDVTRNVVMPHIKRVLASHASIMEGYMAPKPPIHLDYIYQPEIYSTHAGREYIDRWTSVPAASSPGAINLGHYEADEILELCRSTNDQDFNEGVDELLKADGGKGIAEITEVLNGIRNISQLSPKYSLPCLIVLGAIDQPKEGVQSTLTNYNANRTMMSNVAGKMANALVDRMSGAQRSNNVYYSLLQKAGEPVELCGEVCRDLMKQGLTTEALMGNEMLGRKYRGADLLKPENIEHMTQVYNDDLLVRKAAAQEDRQRHSRTAILNALRDDLNAMAEKGEFVIEGDDREKAWGRLRNVADNIMKSPYQNQEPIFIIAACICVTWYAHTDASRFIDIMLDTEKKNPGLKETEFDLLATLRYIVMWTVSQIDIAKE